MELNPYAPPRVDPAPATGPVLRRRQHLLGEATVKFAGLLFMGEAAGLILRWCIRSLLNSASLQNVDAPSAGRALVALMQVLVQSGALAVIGLALWRLKFWARIPALLLCLIGMRSDSDIVAYLLALPCLVHPQAWRVLTRAYGPVRLAAPALGWRSTRLALGMFVAYAVVSYPRNFLAF